MSCTTSASMHVEKRLNRSGASPPSLQLRRKLFGRRCREPVLSFCRGTAGSASQTSLVSRNVSLQDRPGALPVDCIKGLCEIYKPCSVQCPCPDLPDTKYHVHGAARWSETTLRLWETYFGDRDQSVQANADKDLATERNKMPLLFPQSDLLPLLLWKATMIPSRKSSSMTSSLLYKEQSLQCVGAPSFENLSWHTVYS